MLNQNELKTDSVLTNSGAAGELVQRVNLIRFVSKQQEVRLPFKQILQICTLVLIIFLGCSLYSFKERLALNRHIAKLQLQIRESTKEMQSDRIIKMQELMKSGVIRTILHQQRSKNGLGFSNYLATIATVCPDGVWLTSINIDKHSNNTILSGKAYHPTKIVQLVGNLNHEPLFNNAPFFLAKIEKIEEQTIADNKTTSKIIYSFVVQTQKTVGSKI